MSYRSDFAALLWRSRALSGQVRQRQSRREPLRRYVPDISPGDNALLLRLVEHPGSTDPALYAGGIKDMKDWVPGHAALLAKVEHRGPASCAEMISCALPCSFRLRRGLAMVDPFSGAGTIPRGQRPPISAPLLLAIEAARSGRTTTYSSLEAAPNERAMTARAATSGPEPNGASRAPLHEPSGRVGRDDQECDLDRPVSVTGRPYGRSHGTTPRKFHADAERGIQRRDGPCPLSEQLLRQRPSRAR